jgi:hypothetical protein
LTTCRYGGPLEYDGPLERVARFTPSAGRCFEAPKWHGSEGAESSAAPRNSCVRSDTVFPSGKRSKSKRLLEGWLVCSQGTSRYMIAFRTFRLFISKILTSYRQFPMPWICFDIKAEARPPVTGTSRLDQGRSPVCGSPSGSISLCWTSRMDNKRPRTGEQRDPVEDRGRRSSVDFLPCKHFKNLICEVRKCFS